MLQSCKRGDAFVLPAVFLLCCGTPAPVRKEPSFDRRGCRGLAPENTIAAMKRALELGVTTLELDVVITGDSQVLLSHEPFFSHGITTLPGGAFVRQEEEKGLNIYRMTYAETQRYDVGLKPHPRFPRQQKIKSTKPLRGEVMDSADAQAKKLGRPLPFYNIETKPAPLTDDLFHPRPEHFVELLLGVIRARGIANRVAVQSFDRRTLQYLHRVEPGLATAWLVEEGPGQPLAGQLRLLGFTPTGYSPRYTLVTPALVSECRRLGLQLIPWTVNDRETMDRLVAMGVNGIITDYPDLF